MFIGVNVDETVKIKHQLTTAQSVPEELFSSLDLNVSL